MDVEDGLEDKRNFKKQKSKIVESDGTAVDIAGYSASFFRLVIVYTGYFLTCGLLRLIFHWCPHWMLLSTHESCRLSRAQKVLVKDSSKTNYVHIVMISSSDAENVITPEQTLSSQLAANQPAVRAEKNTDQNCSKYFLHKRMKYVWEKDKRNFALLRGWEEQPYCKLARASPLTLSVVVRHRALYGLNEIAIHVTPVIKMLLSECFNPFYCFQAFSCTLWYFEDYWQYATVILIISGVSLVVQVIEMRRNEKALKKTISGSTTVSVCRIINDTAEYQELDSTELVPGDVIKIPRTGCMMQCDALVLSGNCIVNESTLTGESVPVTKTPLPDDQNKQDIFDISSAARHVLFGGTRVIQTRNYADEPVLAIVARTGFRTAKGELVRSILFPKPTKFKFTQDSMKFVAALAVLAAVGFAVSVYLMQRHGSETGQIVLRAFDLVTIVVPPALPMAMTIGIVYAQRRLRRNCIYCINPSVINVCGVINAICFDKTGTLTEDGLDLWGVIANSQGIFKEPEFEPSNLENGPLIECMATCHSLTRIEGVLSGDPLDLKMFLSTKWDFIEEVSEDHCKFGMAVPAVVRPPFEGSLINVPIGPSVDPEMLPYEIGILRQFPFSSSLQRMSVIARVLNHSHFNIYTKGAPETIEVLCRRDTIPSDFHSVLLEYTRQGYRVLALAWRPLRMTYTRVLRIQRERAEQKLQFLGLLIMENRLKPETTPVIESLREANIRPIMVTGDNMLTALSVARDCEIIDEMDKIVLVSAKPPPKAENPQCQLATDDGDDTDPPLTSKQEPPFLILLDTRSAVPENTAIFGSLTDQSHAPLVEFHYAEDLHRPVTEVTATHGPPVRPRTMHGNTTPQKKKNMDSSSWLDRQGMIQKLRFLVPFWKNAPTQSKNLKEMSPPSYDGNFHASRIGDSPSELKPAESKANRLTIRMIDRPDFHLAITGKTWGVIRDHYPWLMPKLVVKGAVFARFSPEQKAQLIETLQSVGYFVAMCGDGANDCAALKAAHVGVSLSETEASVASPFTAKEQNINCIPTLIRQGRCALVTSFGIFKFIAACSMVQFTSVILLYGIGSTMSNPQFLYVDFFLITSLSITFGYTRAYEGLSVDPPSVRLLSFITLMSLGLQLLVNMCIQIGMYVATQAQSWYIPLFKIHEDFGLLNYESTAVFTVAAYQYMVLAIVFSKGPPYRQSILSNPLFIINVLICLACTAIVTCNAFGWARDLITLVRFPSIRFLLLLHGIVLLAFFVCYLSEMFVDGLASRRRLLRIRKALFPRHIQIKDYERIREEIDKLAGSWPPLIRSASVHALPADLFNEEDTTSRICSRQRLASGNSTDSEEDDAVFPTNKKHRDNSALLEAVPNRDSTVAHLEAATFETPEPMSTKWHKVGPYVPQRSHSFDCGEIRCTDSGQPKGNHSSDSSNTSGSKLDIPVCRRRPSGPETTLFYANLPRSRSTGTGNALLHEKQKATAGCFRNPMIKKTDVATRFFP